MFETSFFCHAAPIVAPCLKRFLPCASISFLAQPSSFLVARRAHSCPQGFRSDVTLEIGDLPSDFVLTIKVDPLENRYFGSALPRSQDVHRPSSLSSIEFIKFIPLSPSDLYDKRSARPSIALLNPKILSSRLILGDLSCSFPRGYLPAPPIVRRKNLVRA